MVKVKAIAAALAVVGAMVLGGMPAAQADAMGGPKQAHDVVTPNHVDTYTVVFYGHETATVAVVGDGSARLGLAVYDEGGHLIDTASGDGGCAITWTPKWTGPFTIKVVNLGYDSCEYVLRTN
jgi:hypothetical protein